MSLSRSTIHTPPLLDKLKFVPKYSVRHCFLNNSRTQWARDLRFSPIDRELQGTQVYEQAKNWPCFKGTAVSKSLKDSAIKLWHLNRFLIIVWWIDRLKSLLLIYASRTLIAFVVREISYFYWSSLISLFPSLSNQKTVVNRVKHPQ